MGELVIAHNAGIYISKEDYGEGTNVIGVGNIYDRDIFGGEIYRLGPVNDDKFILEENDILYGESSLVPEGIARTVCVGKNGAGSAFAWHTRRVKLDKNIVNSHVATLELNYHHDIRKYLVSVSTQTALTGMTTEGYFGATLTFPSVEEQQKISDYFKNLDNLITLHQRKLEKLKLVKKSMLEKMFPKNGSSVPEIRFKGFTDDWEQRKLGDYIVEYHEVTTENNQYPALTSSRKGLFLQTEYFAGNQIASDDNTGYNVVPYGYFTYRHMSDDEIFHFNINDIVENGIVSTLYPVFITTDKLDSRYLQYQLNHGHEFARFAVLQKQGGSRTYMYLSKLKQLSLTMPKSVDEQKQISEFFMQLDNIITLHQRKLELRLFPGCRFFI